MLKRELAAEEARRSMTQELNVLKKERAAEEARRPKTQEIILLQKELAAAGMKTARLRDLLQERRRRRLARQAARQNDAVPLAAGSERPCVRYEDDETDAPTTAAPTTDAPTTDAPMMKIMDETAELAPTAAALVASRSLRKSAWPSRRRRREASRAEAPTTAAPMMKIMDETAELEPTAAALVATKGAVAALRQAPRRSCDR